MRRIPSKSAIETFFEYDPSLPLAFRWRKTHPKSRANKGDVAGYWHLSRGGSPNPPLRYLDFPGFRRFPARIAVWILFNESPAPSHFHYADGDPTNIRIENLLPERSKHTDEELKDMRAGYWQKFKSSINKEDWTKRLRERNLRV